MEGGRWGKQKALKSLNESALFPALNHVSKDPKKKKIIMQDYKFFKNSDRLKELFEKEQEARFNPDQWLTNEEIEEKDALLNGGFLEWTWNDY